MPAEIAAPPGVEETGAPRGSTWLHACCVRWLERGILIEGEAASGKSTLVTMMIGAGARLVVDDLVLLQRRDRRLEAAASRLRGHLAVRAQLHCTLCIRSFTTLDLVVRTERGVATDPWKPMSRRTYLGISLPALACDPARTTALDGVRLAALTLAAPPS